MWLAGKTAIVVGAGQSPGGEGLGNGRAVALVFAREGRPSVDRTGRAERGTPGRLSAA